MTLSGTHPEPTTSKFLFASKAMTPFWTVARIYLGWLWLTSGWGMLFTPAWVDPEAGDAIRGFLGGAIERAGASRPP